jgi:hypothetical protein
MSDPNLYHFTTTWRVQAMTGEVADILREPLDLVRWWPSVYLEAQELEPGDNTDGLGRRIRVRTKGWLPYTLVWEFVVTENRYPSRFALEAYGDFAGTGVWTIEQDGNWVNATYEWRITAEKPLLRLLAPVVRPLLEANHRWAMAQGEESLRLELARRRASTAATRAAVPPPPGPVTYAAVALLGGAALVGGTVAALIVRQRRRAKQRRREGRQPRG